MAYSKAFQSLILLGFLLGIGLISYALFAQHVQELYPCVRCIYQRCALLLIILAGAIGLMHHRLQILAFMGSSSAGIFGLYQSYIHIGVIKGTIIDTCGFRPDFGALGHLDRSFPWLLSAGGDCADDSWQVLSLNMPEWMFIIFSFYIIVSLLCLCLWMQKRLQKNECGN